MTDDQEQPGFHYFQCPDCGFDSVQPADYDGTVMCPLCASDSYHKVGMTRRVARASDKPEGRDAREEAP